MPLDKTQYLRVVTSVAGPGEVEMDRLMVDGAPTAPVDVSEGTFFKRRNSDAIWEINIGYACFVTVDTYVRQACAKNADGFSSFLSYFFSLGMIRR